MKLLLPFLLLFFATPTFAITCAEVTCDEARNYPAMDRDNDGYYCESQCGNYTPKAKVTTKAVKTTTTTKIATKPITKPATKTATKVTSKYILGPKGGCYYLSKTAKKIYVDKKYCK